MLRGTKLMDNVIHVAQAPCDMRLDALDLDRIRRIYQQIGERCLSAVQSQRLDLDDVIFEHRAFFDVSGERLEVRVDSIGEKDSWRNGILEAIRKKNDANRCASPAEFDPDAAHCRALKIAVLRDAADPLIGFLSPDERSPSRW